MIVNPVNPQIVLILIQNVYFCRLKKFNEGMGIKTYIGWKQAWQSNRFRRLFIFGMFGFILPIFVWPIFLKHIEQRNGIVLHDFLLEIIPAKDLSVPIFACLWSAALIMLIRILQQPKLFLMFMYSYWTLFIARMITIKLTPLNPPAGLLKLRDPISNLFYGNGGAFITKDLFFSGHTATLLLIFLFLEKKWEKWFVFAATVAVGIMVLFQHIHYSVDVFAAPVFAFAIYWMIKKWLGDIFFEVKIGKELKRKSMAD